MSKLKIYWPVPVVRFNGKGISEAWRDEMARAGWSMVDNAEQADIFFYPSDSQIDRAVVGTKPSICYFWGWPTDSFLYSGAQQALNEKIGYIARCHCVLVPSYITYYQTQQMGVPCNVLYPGADTTYLDILSREAFGDPPVYPRRERRVMFLSRIMPYKGLEDLIRAMAMLNPIPELLACGPGDTRSYRDLALQLGVPVSFREPTDLEKVRLLAGSALLVHPSHYEGFGLPPLEALYLGTPVVVRSIPQMFHLLQGSAIYFESVQELAASIDFAFGNPDAMKGMIDVGRRMIGERYNLKVASAQLGAAIGETVREFCGAVMRTHPERASEIYDLDHKRNWDLRVQNFDPTWSRHWRAQHIVSELRKVGAKNIGDIGSGAVYPTIFARAGFKVTAYDHSRECLSQVEEVSRRWGVGGQVQTMHGRAQELPFPAGFFDAIVLGEILEHVSDPDVVLAQAIRVVKHGGAVVCTTPVGSHHFDPMHIGPAGGGWDAKSLQKLVAPYQVTTFETVAEEGTEPSCYLVTVVKS